MQREGGKGGGRKKKKTQRETELEQWCSRDGTRAKQLEK
jgi:hypothetical protein